jgi:hypothetical protein
VQTSCKEERMRKEKEKKEQRKVKYVKPVLTKHKKLKDITAQSTGMRLGCTKFFI